MDRGARWAVAHGVAKGSDTTERLNDNNLTCRFLSGQRVTGAQLSPSLQYFGQSLSGGQDLTQDGLADLAVGAQGHALLLR